MNLIQVKTACGGLFRRALLTGLIFLCISVFPGLGQKNGSAEKFAIAFYQTHAPSNLQSEVKFDKISRYNNILVFEQSFPPTFILVKEGKTPQIAGYSFANLFHQGDSLPEPARITLEALQTTDLENYIGRSRLKSLPAAVEPMLQTEWNQDHLSNYFCPEDPKGPGGKVYTGCVAVAMGQIVRYYHRWNEFFFEASFDHWNYGTLHDFVGAYDWDKMEDKPICTSLEVSRLLYHMGIITDMGYSGTVSSTSNYQAYNAFKKLNYLHLKRMLKAFVDPEKWVSEFYRNISEYKPLYVTGWGHAYVCDGYDSNGFFHFNLGWGGYSNGYYPLTGEGAFSNSEAFVDIFPYSWLFPPINVSLEETDESKIISWHVHREADVKPLRFRIYSNEQRVFEQTDSVFNAKQLGPGVHRVQVTAFYPSGESRWTGPITIINPPEAAVIPDQALRKALNQALRIPEEQWLINHPNKSELKTIESISIAEPLRSLEGIQYCEELKILKIGNNGGEILDLSPLADIQNLRILEIENVAIEDFNPLKQNTWLINLHLKDVQVEAFDQFVSLKDLISLKISNVPVDHIESLEELPLLRTLRLHNCGIVDVDFLPSLNHIQYLDLSQNKIERIELNHYLNNLRELNLDDNRISRLWFTDYLRNIERLSLNSNKIRELDINRQFNFLKQLNLSSNLIDTLNITSDLPSLEKADFSHNQIRYLESLVRYASGLQNINVSDNKIANLWNVGLQNLTKVDISDNQITIIDPLLQNPAIEYLDVSGNTIGDFYPLIRHDYYLQLDYFNVETNPVSKESVVEYFPFFKDQIETFIEAVAYQPYVPCYPQPARKKYIEGSETVLSWYNETGSQDVNYDVYFGIKGQMKLYAKAIEQTEIVVPIGMDESYQWQVICNTTDARFYSGIYDFRTYIPLEMPYYESFETYQPFEYIAQASPFWRTTNNDPGSSEDAQIVSFRSLDGHQSLRLVGQSRLGIIMNHFDGYSLNIKFGIQVEDGGRGAVLLKDIAGSDLGIYLKPNRRGDIIYKDQTILRFQYQLDTWNLFHFFISATHQTLDIRMGGRSLIRLDLAFPQDRISFGSIEFSTERSYNYPHDGYPLFYIDKIYISGAGATGVETIQLEDSEIIAYPNPVGDQLSIESEADNPIESLSLINSLGQELIRLRPDLLETNPIRMDVSNYEPGLYILVGNSRKGRFFKRILIN